MKFLDAHCHFFIIFKEFYSDFLKYTHQQELTAAFLNSEMPDKASFYSFFEFKKSKKHKLPKLVFFSALHPWKTHSIKEWEYQHKPQLEERLKQSKEIFIGETGLDKIRGAKAEIQKEIFKSHIELALKYKRPFTIHCVKSWGNCINILKSFLDSKNDKIPFIVHGFSGSAEIMSDLIKIGGYISFSATAIIRGNKKTLDNITKIDIKKLLIETDFPYSAVNNKGDIMEFQSGKEAGEFYIKMLKKAYKKTAEIKNISVEQLSRILEENGKIFTDYTAYRQ